MNSRWDLTKCILGEICVNGGLLTTLDFSGAYFQVKSPSIWLIAAQYSKSTVVFKGNE